LGLLLAINTVKSQFVQGNGSVNACSGTFTDSGGAGNYSNNENSVFTICSSASNCVSVTFTTFNLESGFDDLVIHDGPTTASPVIGTFSGTTSPGTITSSSGCLTFAFSSDGSVTRAGWSATISCAPCPGCLPNMSNCTVNACAGNFFDSGGLGGNYSSNENFVKTICATNPGDCVTLTFTAFDLESGFDNMTIHDGATTAATVIGTFSGTALPGPITSTTGCLTIAFSSDGSVTRAGWAATISCTPCIAAPCLPIMSNCSTNACSGSFFDSGGLASNYSNNANLTTTICAMNPGDCVSLTFTAFATEAGFDELTIHNGATAASPIIGVFSGTGSPGTVVSTTGCLTLVFTSDGSVTSAGWEATISCAPCGSSNPCVGVPDSCLIACNLGILPTHTACSNSTNPGQGTTVLSTGLSNVGATPQNPYTSIIGCQGLGGGMASPANDVWYQFTLNSPSLQVELLNSTLDSASIGLWEFTGSCTTLTPQGCATSGNGNLTATFDLLTPGSVYYLQISGGVTAPNTGTFDLQLTGFEDCSQCIQGANLSVNPLPINGNYAPGTCVTFTFDISSWNFTLANWLHGVIPTFGNGWNTTTMASVAPSSCDLSGGWAFYNSCTSSATSVVFGPGFYYDSNSGGPLDGNPGNNFGDNCACCWTFSWTICTQTTCNPGDDLSVTINTTGDGESGSWTSLSCTSDPVFFAATATCALPVDFTAFTGRIMPEGNQLLWTTGQEINSELFTIERSFDGNNWQDVGEVPANGTSSAAHNYEFVDPFPFGGRLLYRLRQQDFNGYTGTSETIELTRTSGWKTNIGNIYPNPVRKTLSLDLTFANEGNYLLEVMDLRGAVVLQRSLAAKIGYEKIDLNVEKLALGTYFVRLSSPKAGRRTTVQFVKE
ncbi:MAG TPA: T9SS type A sorting domain-containing protein, partial [Bacteroidetes bacterium]|nr:T9SS type A sorting domain-containing protein [Bacteroidota bacterium]